ncbi:glycosyl transferase family 39 [Phormidium sp. CLA17]|nr:glycosyl transferase family 39 [Leptolyngbya sp. Cla-17]
MHPLRSHSERIRFPLWLKWLLVCLLVLGVVFRFVNLNHKVYWHDETYTSLRAAGYTRDEIDKELFQNRVIAASELQKFQRIKPGSTSLDTLRSLAVEDPQHPPLYFLMTRLWMQILGTPLEWMFHSPLTVTRSLPALISLLTLPAMYALAWQLFGLHDLALLAATLMALSPFDVLFAQTARQYSLLTLMVVVSSYLFLRALHLTNAPPANRSHHYRKPPPLWHCWALYGFSVTIGLYTHPFFALTLAGHAAYVGLDSWLTQGTAPLKNTLIGFVSAIAGAIILYFPWLVVMISNAQRAFATTDWTQFSPGIDYLLKLWTLSFTALFFDLDFGFNNPWTYLARVPILILIFASLYSLCRRTRSTTWLFVLTSILVPFLLLAIPDVVLGNKRSAVSRYLISCFPGVQLAVAYFLATKLSMTTLYSGRSSKQIAPSTAYTLRPKLYTPLIPFLWRGTLAGLLAGCLISLTVSALSDSWWNKDLSYANDKTADLINQTPAPLIISDIGDDFTNTGDLISLSYRLNKPVSLLLVNDPKIVDTPEFQTSLQGNTAIAFRPSRKLQVQLEQTYGKLSQAIAVEKLWKIPSTKSISEKKAGKIKRNVK